MRRRWLAAWLSVLVGCAALGGSSTARALPSAGVSRDAAWVAQASLGQQRVKPKGYWDKNHIYHLLDALILSSPLTGIAAVVLFFDPELRQRPPGIWWGRKDDDLKLSPRYRTRVRRKLAAVVVLGALCFLGLLTLLFHLLDLIPHI